MSEPTATPTITSTVNGLTLLPLQQQDGRLSFSFDCPRGLYLFSVIMDARDFDWEQLYETLNKYHNVDERTGPWDFSINYGAIPLVPAYWVTVNGQRLGLWFFERVSLEDIERRHFRGKFTFYANGPATVELALFQTESQVTPSLEDERHSQQPKGQPADQPPAPPVYDRSGLQWVSATLETDPEDKLEPLPPLKDASQSPAAQWRDPEYWQSLRDGLASTHALYQEPLQRTCDWLRSRDDYGAEDLMLLLAVWRLGLWDEALPRALETIDRLVAMRYWSNQNPAGYSHNGDMGAMQCLRGLAFAYHGLHDELGDDRRQRLLDKLRYQGEIFFNLALLNREYWGGSVVQDHGWKSLFGFAVAAMHLYGVLPEADRWLQFLLPRLRRSLDAMPRDGVVPPTSHQALYLYLDDVSQFRDALLAQGGQDIYDQPQFLPILDYLATTLDLPRGQCLTVGIDRIRFIGGAQFLNQMAGKHRNRTAAWLQVRMQQVSFDTFYHGTQLYGYYLGAVWGLMSHDPAVLPLQPPAPPRLKHFPDSGLVHYRDDAAKVALSVRCGPLSGYNSHRGSLCSCDRLDTVPAAGHFSFYVDGVPLLCSPDGGYKLHGGLRSILLIDGQGQYGDIGYPMSIPSKLHRGEQVQVVEWDEAREQGLIRLFITPAYPQELGVAHYTRDFLLTPDQITVRDTVVLENPRQLSWLFQGKQDRKVAVDGLTGLFGPTADLKITPQTTGLALSASVEPTHVVWSYASGNNFEPFEHVRYDTVESVRQAVVDFVLTWE